VPRIIRRGVLGELRLWRLDPKADYGMLDSVARHPIKPDLIARHWDDLLRVAGSLTEGALAGSAALRMLQSGGRYSTLGRAVAEYGRIAKSLFLLSYLDDGRYRRRGLHQINRQEGRHRLARAVFYGQKGELRQHYREGQEDQLSALGLVLNLLILWNTRYTQRILEYMRNAASHRSASRTSRSWVATSSSSQSRCAAATIGRSAIRGQPKPQAGLRPVFRSGNTGNPLPMRVRVATLRVVTARIFGVSDSWVMVRTR